MIDAKEYRTRIYETWSIPMLETSAISVVGRMLDPSDQMQQGEGNGALLRSSFAAWKMKPAANSNYPQILIQEPAFNVAENTHIGRQILPTRNVSGGQI